MSLLQEAKVRGQGQDECLESSSMGRSRLGGRQSHVGICSSTQHRQEEGEMGLGVREGRLFGKEGRQGSPSWKAAMFLLEPSSCWVEEPAAARPHSPALEKAQPSGWPGSLLLSATSWSARLGSWQAGPCPSFLLRPPHSSSSLKYSWRPQPSVIRSLPPPMGRLSAAPAVIRQAVFLQGRHRVQMQEPFL